MLYPFIVACMVGFVGLANAETSDLTLNREVAQSEKSDIVPPDTNPSRPSVTRESQETLPVPASPEEPESRLTKNWGGARKKLSDFGIDVGMVYKGNAVRNFSGGVEPGTEYLGNLDLRLSFDGEKLFNWKGSTFFFYFLADHGGHPLALVGNAQGVNNVETRADFSAKLFEAWYQQFFEEERASVLVGLHDLNSEFYVTNSSGVFLNPVFGIGPELAQTSGANGPSIFPTAAPALRLRVEPSKDFYLQLGLFNALSGETIEPRGTHVSLDVNKGFLLISEFAYQRGRSDPQKAPGKYGVGVWTYTNTFDHQVDVTSDGLPVASTSRGAYFLLEQTVFDGVSVFWRYGLASPEVNRFKSATQLGVQLTGVPGRPDDRLGLSFASATNGSEYLVAQERAETPQEDTESVLELTYRLELIPGFAIQPDFQYVMNPNTDPSLEAASVGTLRFELNF